MRPGSQAWRYTLGLRGEALIAAEQDQLAPRPSAHADRVLRLARSTRLEHLLGTNEFFVALAHRTHQVPGTAMRWWLNEHRATDLCAGLAQPVGFGTWSEQHPGDRAREVSFFLEVDTGTEPLQRLLDRLPGYADARLGGGPQHPILFWLPSARRETNFQKLLAHNPSPVTVATATTHTGDGTVRIPADPVWLIPGQHTRQRLIELASGWADHLTAG